MLLPSMSLQVMGEIASVNMASLGGCLHSKTTVKWAEGCHDEANSHTFDLDRDGLGKVVPCP